MRTRAVRQQTRDRHADKGLQSVPYKVEAWDFIGDKFNRKQSPVYRNDGPVSQDFQSLRQGYPVCVRQQAERQHRGINIQTCGKACRDDEGCEDVGREDGHSQRILQNASSIVILGTTVEAMP